MASAGTLTTLSLPLAPSPCLPLRPCPQPSLLLLLPKESRANQPSPRPCLPRRVVRRDSRQVCGLRQRGSGDPQGESWGGLAGCGDGEDPLRGDGTWSPATAGLRVDEELWRLDLGEEGRSREGAHSEPVQPPPAVSQTFVQAPRIITQTNSR